VVEEDEVRLALLAEGLDLLDLAAAHEGGHVRRVAGLQHRAEHLGAGGPGQHGQLAEVVLLLLALRAGKHGAH